MPASSLSRRLILLLCLFALAAAGLSIGGVVVVDRAIRRDRAVAMARADIDRVREKLKGLAEDRAAAPLVANAALALESFAARRADGAARGRHLAVRIAGQPSATWPRAIERRGGDVVRLTDGGADAFGIVARFPSGVELLVAYDVAPGDPLRPLLVRLGLSLALLLPLLAGLTAWAVMRDFNRRIRLINRTCDAVEGGAVASRIDGAGSDEIGGVALRVNRMLDRLQTQFEALRDVSDKIAHDLRTPLARVRAHLAVVDVSDEAARRVAVERATDEVDKLVRTCNALLSLRDIESGPGADMEPVALDQAVVDAVELYEALAEDSKGVRIVVSVAPVVVSGVRPLIVRAIANLIDNALKASPAGGVIAVGLTRAAAGSGGEIVVADQGSGLPAAILAELQRPEVRPMLRSMSGGHGLGLSVVLAVLRRHGGALRVRSSDPHGTCLVLHFP